MSTPIIIPRDGNGLANFGFRKFGAPRVEYDNIIVNNRMTGAAAPATIPTGWLVILPGSIEILNVDLGILDVRFFDVGASNQFLFMQPSIIGQPALPNEWYSYGITLSLIGGSFNNIASMWVRISTRNNVGAGLGFDQASLLNLTSKEKTYTTRVNVANPLMTGITTDIFSVGTGAYDISLRIKCPVIYNSRFTGPPLLSN